MYTAGQALACLLSQGFPPSSAHQALVAASVQRDGPQGNTLMVEPGRREGHYGQVGTGPRQLQPLSQQQSSPPESSTAVPSGGAFTGRNTLASMRAEMGRFKGSQS